jgi:ankyrin repeat protein
MKTFWQDESQGIEQAFKQMFLIRAFAQDDILRKLGGQNGLCWGIGFEVIRKCKFNQNLSPEASLNKIIKKLNRIASNDYNESKQIVVRILAQQKYLQEFLTIQGELAKEIINENNFMQILDKNNGIMPAALTDHAGGLGGHLILVIRSDSDKNKFKIFDPEHGTSHEMNMSEALEQINIISKEYGYQNPPMFEDISQSKTRNVKYVFDAPIKGYAKPHHVLMALEMGESKYTSQKMREDLGNDFLDFIIISHALLKADIAILNNALDFGFLNKKNLPVYQEAFHSLLRQAVIKGENTKLSKCLEAISRVDPIFAQDLLVNRDLSKGSLLNFAITKQKYFEVSALLNFAQSLGSEFLREVLSTQDATGRTALTIAASNSKFASLIFDYAQTIGNEFVIELIEKRGISGDTSVHLFAHLGQNELLAKVLNFYKIHFNSRIGNLIGSINTYGETALQTAVLNGEIDSVKLLLDYIKTIEPNPQFFNSQLEHKNKSGKTVFELSSDDQINKLLVDVTLESKPNKQEHHIPAQVKVPSRVISRIMEALNFKGIGPFFRD